jgi:putative glutamine amidotransferase
MQTQAPVPGETPLAWIMGQNYVRRLVAEGAIPCLIPLLPDDLATSRVIYDRLDGLFLTGGYDIDPSRYGEERLPVCGSSDTARDAVELTLLDWAAADSMPVWGVCRGAQVINVAAGGTLYQDLRSQVPNTTKHDCFPTPGGYQRDTLIHEIQVNPETRLGRLLGVSHAQVNSMHHQGIKAIGRGLATNAVAPDGVVEGIEGTGDQFLIGTLWHPEELVDTQPAMRRLLVAFMDAARAFRLVNAAP